MSRKEGPIGLFDAVSQPQDNHEPKGPPRTGRSALSCTQSRRYGARMTITIRPAMPTDAEALERFYAGLSEDSRHLRFFGCTRGISHDQSVSFCTPDHAHREGFVAVAPSGRSGDDIIVGHLCLEPVDASTVEVAIAVADQFQHRGIGRRLMNAGIAWARQVGIARLTATTLSANVPIRRLLAGLGLAVSTTAESLDTSIVSIEVSRPLPAAA